jgi:hypothetical protein
MPLFWPKIDGKDQSTQIEEGDLFDFDMEIEPILNTLLTKILDESRMEVLEEDEIAQVKAKQRYFEEIRNREFMEVQRLDNAEIRRNQEIVLFII